MAINPNAAIAQPSGWALGGLGAPSQSTIPLARPQSVLTPEQIAQLRQQAMTLQQPPEGGIHHWTQGLAELARAIQGNHEADFARQQEAAGRQQGAEATSSMLAPYLSPGGAPAPAAGGAPAGAGGGASIGSAAQSTDTTTQTADASAPRGIRNNNPLNIEDGQFARAQPGYAGSDGRFAKFETPEHGVGAADSLLTSYQNNHGLNTVAGIVGRWAPASDNNDTKAYAAHVASQLGIGPNDPIPSEMRPQLIAAMAQHENGRPLVLSATPSSKVAPTGLLAPIQPPPAVVPPPAAPSAAPAPTAPTRLAYAGNPPPGMVPPTAPASPLSPMISAIAGQPIPPADFARQAAATEAAKAGGAAPLPTPGAAIPPADFARQAAAMEAAKSGPTVPPVLASLPAQAGPTAAPATPTPISAPQAGPNAPLPPPFIPSGGSTPGAIGPTAVNGQPLDYTASLPRPPLGAPPANPAAVAAIAGRPVPPVAAPAVGSGAPIPPPPVQVAQNGPPTSAVPSPTGGPPGLPQPLTSPTGQITQGQLTQVLANPWIPDSTKQAMLTMIQQRGQVQTFKVPGGTLQVLPGTGQQRFIPEEVPMKIKHGTTEIEGRAVYDPNTGRYHVQALVPDAPATSDALAHPAQAQGAPTTPQPDLSSIGGMEAADVAEAGAKKGAETSAETGAKYYDSLHKGLAGSAMIASQQKQNIDALRQIANSPDFVSGTFADSALAMQRLASTLGINPTGAAPRELFNQLSARVLADQFSGLKSIASTTGESAGRIFAPMLAIEEKANITPEDSAEGINAKLNLLDNAGNLMMKYGDMADDYVAKNGKLDPTFDKELRKEIAGSRIPNVVPQKEQSTAPTPTAPAPKTIGDKTYYQNPEGKWFDNPEFK